MFDIEIIEEINDGNFYLRKISLDDIQFFYESLKEEDMTQLLSLGALESLKHSKKLIKNYLRYWDQYLQFYYIIELREENLIKRLGSTSLWDISWLHRRSEVGIWILPNYWEKGYGKKAIEMIKIIAFQHLKLNRLEAHISVNNTRSINLFKKCGFFEEGTLREYLNLKGILEVLPLLKCRVKSFLLVYLYS